MITKWYLYVSPKNLNRLVVQNEEFGGAIYVHKRPHLREFLQKVRQLGDVTVFTQNISSYADPIIDQLDPDKKIFKHRFYGEHCIRNGEGEILKDMSVLERFVEATDPQQDPTQNGLSFSQKLNNALGVPIFGVSAFTPNVVAVTNAGSIQLSKNLLQKLLIVDDSILTYNSYKSKNIKSKWLTLPFLDNTIRISQWKKSMR